MQAVVQDRYGGPERLEIAEVDTPSVGAGSVLVRVHAASVNPLDWHVMRGLPLIARPSMGGVRGPKPRVRGVDLSGVVEAVGDSVTRFRPGDEVYGTGAGSFAAFCLAPAPELAAKPTRLSFEQAAAVPVAAITALQLLRDVGAVRSGQSVLINGAAGGVGTFGVQIATALGAVVTGVCSARNLELVRSLGAAHVIDYKAEDFTTAGEQYDIILDNIANHSLSATRRALKPEGTLVSNSGRGGSVIGPLKRIMMIGVLARFSQQRMRFALAKVTAANLDALTSLIDDGKLAPVIERVYPLDEIADAIRHVEQEHTRGKVVISLT